MPKTVTGGCYFIGANTSSGFVNYTDEILCGVDRVYIIKGGPGTGKSTLMKRFAEFAEAHGHTAERYYCSSDSSSLDGVVLRDAGIGVIDGTAPHCAEPKYPGAREELVNLGAFWNAERLRSRFDEIKSLCDRKSECFAAVYKYLSVCRVIKTERDRLLSSCQKHEKARKAVHRMMSEVGHGGGFALHPRQISAVGMCEVTELDTYAENADEVWLVSDRRDVSGMLFNMIISEAEKLGLEAYISRDHLLEPNALYFPEKRLAVVGSCDAGRVTRLINCERFIDSAVLSEHRMALRFLKKLENEMFDRALSLLGEVKACHFMLENIYSGAMDFNGLDAVLDRITAEV